MTRRNELVRKLIHFSTLVIPLGMMILPRRTILLVLGFALLTAVIVEICRRLFPGFGAWFLKRTSPLLRKHEEHRITGATFLFLSAFISVLVFREWIAQVALLLVIISDGLGALVGKLWGRKTSIKGKTWEGSAVFIISGLLIVFFHPACDIRVGILGVLAAFLVEVLVTGLDDNLTIPLAAGIVLEAGTRLIG